MRTIIFKYNPWGVECSSEIEEIKVEDNTTDEEIRKLWRDWTWERVADHSSWYEKVNQVSDEDSSDDMQTYLFKAGEKFGRIIIKHNDVPYAHAALTSITGPSVSFEDKLSMIMLLCIRYQTSIPVEITDKDNGEEYIRTYIMGATSMYKK